jgi:hypothetical protein
MKQYTIHRYDTYDETKSISLQLNQIEDQKTELQFFSPTNRVLVNEDIDEVLYKLSIFGLVETCGNQIIELLSPDLERAKNWNDFWKDLQTN